MLIIIIIIITNKDILEGVLSLVFRYNGTECRSPTHAKKLILPILLEIILKESVVSLSSKRSFT